MPDWLKTPALIRYQWITERWVESALRNYTLYVMFEDRKSSSIYGYAYDEESDSLVPAEGWMIVHIAAEPVVRLVLSEKGLGPELFKSPLANSTRSVLGAIKLLYEKTRTPDTRRYVLEYHRNRGAYALYPLPEPTPTNPR